MNILNVGKKSAQLCVSTLMMSIILLPVQAAEIVPVPVFKPVSINIDNAPLPHKKPLRILALANVKESPIDIVLSDKLKSKGLRVASLFSTGKYDDRNIKHYINGYKALSSEQSKLYAKIFELQALGDMAKADVIIDQINDKSLFGAVLYQRYMHNSYKSSFAELKSWMDLYFDHPGADRVYKLALLRGGAGDRNKVNKPNNGKMLAQINEPTISYPKSYVSKALRSNDQKMLVKKLSRKIRALVRIGKSSEALVYFRAAEHRKLMDHVEHDTIQSKIAAGFLYSRHFNSAYKLASQSSARSGEYVPNAAWVAGLALWNQGDFEGAAKYFTKISSSPYASGWLKSAGLYWAARSYQRTGDNDSLVNSLNQAAKHSRTFYGLMAAKSLGQEFDFNWKAPEYSVTHEEIILGKEAGKRAFSLVAAGQYDLAAAELLRLDYKGNSNLRRAVLAYASHVGLPSISLRLGNMVQRSKGGYYDSAIYPISPWSPKGGYKLDPALVHAIIRQESRFSLHSISRSGAVGLMQVMPKTAKYVAKKNNYSGILSNYKLRLPEMNMKIGQDYIEYLLKNRNVNYDVVSMLVAYNAGPGNLAKWRKNMGDNKDDLLFIEMMPIKETRDYVERVLSNYWIYRDRAGLELPSLVALSNGKSPKYTYVMQAGYPYKLAAN